MINISLIVVIILARDYGIVSHHTHKQNVASVESIQHRTLIRGPRHATINCPMLSHHSSSQPPSPEGTTHVIQAVTGSFANVIDDRQYSTAYASRKCIIIILLA